MSQADLKIYSWAEIAKHNTDDDCWVVMYDKVLDVSKWLDIHPGGLDPIKDMAGMDITSSFESIGHTSSALVKSKTFIIGRVDPAESKKLSEADKKSNTPAPKWSETNPEELRRYKAGGEIVPLWMILAGALMLLLAVYYMLN